MLLRRFKHFFFWLPSIFLGLSPIVSCTTTPQDTKSIISSEPASSKPLTETPQCSAQSRKGDLCLARLEGVRPTQFCVGYQDVERKRKKISSNTAGPDSGLRFSEKNPGSAILGPEDIIYLVDGHHRARALLDAASELFHIRILDDFSHLTMTDFWDGMARRKFVWLYDCEGRGPQSPLELPASLKELKDDPYRTLAEDAQDRGANKKLDVLYQEFYWANFYRSRIPSETLEQNYESAIESAIQLAKTQEAKDLPGFNGALNP